MLEQNQQQQLSTQQQLDEILDEVKSTRGETEVHSRKIEQLVERQRELYQELEERFTRFSAAQQNQAAQVDQPWGPTVVATTTAAPEPEMVYSDSINENEAYDQAMNLVLKERRYDDAIPQFRAFIKKFPDSVYAAQCLLLAGAVVV